MCVLSGAGLSTESGIPDYRSGAVRARLPMTLAEFSGSTAARQRYWARAHIGWPRIAAAQPNAGHLAVAALQQAGVLRGIITQNVDGLHQAAGARDVIELHGTLDRVVCLECVLDRRAEKHDRTRSIPLASLERPWERRDVALRERTLGRCCTRRRHAPTRCCA